MTEATTFRLYGERELRLIESRLGAGIRDWSTRWRGSATRMPVVTASPVSSSSVEQGRWWVAPERSRELPTMQLNAGAQAFFSRVCFGERLSNAQLGGETMGTRVLAEAMASLLASCSGSGVNHDDMVEVAGPVLGADYSATGAIQIMVAWEEETLTLLFPVDVVLHLLPDPVRRAPTLAACRLHELALGETVHLSLFTHPTTFALHEVSSVSPGDVIRLDHRLADPLEVRTATGTVIANAVLGQLDQRLVAKLVSKSA